MTIEKKLVLFDIDQTLLARVADGSDQMFSRVFQLSASEDDIDNTGKTELLIINQVLQKVAPHLLPISDESLARAYQEWALATKTVIQQHPPQILPGVLKLLSLFSESSKVEMGLLTGNSKLRAEVKLVGVEIDHYFRNSAGQLIGVFGDEAWERKELIAVACSKFGINQEQLVIVDDSLIGAMMARDLGVEAILLATGSASAAELKKLAKNVFPNLDNGHAEMVYDLIINSP